MVSISYVADELMQESTNHQCSLKEAYDRHLDPLLRDVFSFEEVEKYIHQKMELGKSICDKESVL